MRKHLTHKHLLHKCLTHKHLTYKRLTHKHRTRKCLTRKRLTHERLTDGNISFLVINLGIKDLFRVNFRINFLFPQDLIPCPSGKTSPQSALLYKYIFYCRSETLQYAEELHFLSTIPRLGAQQTDYLHESESMSTE